MTLCLWICACGIFQQVAGLQKIMDDSKIAGGRDVKDIRKYPYMVNVFLKDPVMAYRSICGGCILTKEYVLTACHCVAEPLDESDYVDNPGDVGQYSFVAGSLVREYPQLKTGRGEVQIRLPKTLYIHPDCWVGVDGDGSYDDLALAKMDKTFSINEFVKPVPLLTHYYSVFDDKASSLLRNSSTVCEVAGWGRTKESPDGKKFEISKTLKVLRVFQVPEKRCESIYKEKVNDQRSLKTFFPLDDRVCASGLHMNETACVGDSGGPLVCNGFLVGITMAGYGCNPSSLPGICHSISPMYEWIRKKRPKLAKKLGIKKCRLA